MQMVNCAKEKEKKALIQKNYNDRKAIRIYLLEIMNNSLRIIQTTQRNLYVLCLDVVFYLEESFGLCFMCLISDSKFLTLRHSFGHLFVMYMIVEISCYQYHENIPFTRKISSEFSVTIDNDPLHTSAKKENNGEATWLRGKG